MNSPWAAPWRNGAIWAEPMKRPHAVVFDLGKVLVDFDYGIAARSLERHCQLSADGLRQLLDQSPLLHRYESGGLTTSEFFEAVRQTAGFQGDLEAFRSCFGGIFTPIEEMIELHARVRRGGLPTYIFSNTNEIAIGHIRRSFPFFGGFTDYIYSFQHGAMKPEERLYEVVERQAGCSGADLLYVDDRPENVATALTRGWQTILHVNAMQTRSLLERRRVL
jgi:FMN phosphatase YigB (HAD superfamily)